MNALANVLGLAPSEAFFWLPLVLVGLLFLIAAASVVFDGFDIGVGCLMPFASDPQRTRMMHLLRPWRDANELWLLLGLALFLAAFPKAWSVVMRTLYLPLTLLAAGVVLRSVAFEFSQRSPRQWRTGWHRMVALGSWLTAMAHGFILGKIVSAYLAGPSYMALGSFFALCAVAMYGLLGATWLVMHDGQGLRVAAARWACRCVRWVAAGVTGLSVVLVLANPGVFIKWGSRPDWALLTAIWGGLFVAFLLLELLLRRAGQGGRLVAILPFCLTLAVVLVVLGGVGYSFFPFLVLDNLTVWDAAASLPSLRMVLAAAAVMLPLALGFNLWVYWGWLGRRKEG